MAEILTVQQLEQRATIAARDLTNLLMRRNAEVAVEGQNLPRPQYDSVESRLSSIFFRALASNNVIVPSLEQESSAQIYKRLAAAFVDAAKFKDAIESYMKSLEHSEKEGASPQEISKAVKDINKKLSERSEAITNRFMQALKSYINAYEQLRTEPKAEQENVESFAKALHDFQSELEVVRALGAAEERAYYMEVAKVFHETLAQYLQSRPSHKNVR